MNIDNVLIGLFVFLLFFGMPIYEWIGKRKNRKNKSLMNVEDSKIERLHTSSDAFQGITKRKDIIKDAEMCLLRDIYVIAYNNDGPSLNNTTMQVIAKITKGIDSNKKDHAQQISPELIEDLFPTDEKGKKEYLFNLLEEWKHSGDFNKRKTLMYIKDVAKKMGIPDNDYSHVYRIVMDFDPLD